MRFRRREAGQKASAAPGHIEDVPFTTDMRPGPPKHDEPAQLAHGGAVPLSKAERMLGIPHRRTSLAPPAPYSPQEPVGKSAVSEKGTANSDLWSANAAREHQPMDTSPGSNGGLKPWPSLQSKNNHASMHDMLAPGGGWAPPMHAQSNTAPHHHQPQPHHHHITHAPSDSTLRSHYDASRQPLTISQQTSDSAIRDMALRKGSPKVASNGDETNGRPLKSSLKHPSHQPEKPASKKEGSRFPRFGHFLPRNNSSNRSVLQSSQYGSTLSVNSTSGSAIRSPSFSNNETPGASSAEHVTRPKIFETDVFDSSKVHIKRPPKGITNWFDGVDISSDEDDQGTTEALPSTFSPYEEPPRKQSIPEPPKQSAAHHHNDAAKAQAKADRKSHRASRQPGKPTHNREKNASDAFVEENAMAIDLARQRMQEMRDARVNRPKQATSRNKRASGESYAPSAWSYGNSIMSGAQSANGSARQGDSRLAQHKLASESVLSLSDNSEDDDDQGVNIRQSVGASSHYTADVIEASPVSVQRPSIAPRRFMSKRSNTRESVMTTQTSGSIPIHWSNDAPAIPTMPMPRRMTQDSTVEHTTEALRKLIGREPSLSARRPRPASSKYESDGSVAGETIASQNTDISRMMAVTEEEMALLEMMRLKRAAMQKEATSEAARQTLKQEQDHLIARQKNAQEAAKKLLKAKEERGRPRPDDATMPESRRDHERIAGLSSLREEDVDDQLRIERFLASQTPLEEVFPFPDPPVRERQGSAPDDSAPMEDLLLPRTYTPQPPSQKSKSKSRSPAPPSEATASGAEDLEADEIAALEADMREFLGGDTLGESSAFPMPPKASSRRASRRVPRANGLLAPVLPSTAEEETTPPIPNRSPRRMPDFADESVLPQPQQNKNRQTRMRADSGALHIQPPIASLRPHPERSYEPPTPSDRSERLSAFLGPSFEVGFNTADLKFPTSASTSASQASNMRFDSPSISTSQASPLTPTFPTPPANGHETLRPVEIASHDNLSLHAYDAADQRSLRAPSVSSSHSHNSRSKHRQSKVALPAQLDTLSQATYKNDKTPSRARMNSVGSSNSASDDVLAAWASLGGVSDSFPSRGRSPMHAR